MIASALESIEGFRDKWPFAARYARVNGWRMHYVDEGAGDPILLLHGNSTWGYLYRDVIPPLVSAGYRVIVPDMIGFGLSEKPAREQAHSLDAHIANLTGLLRQLDLQRLTVVCHDWGGPTGLGFAMSNPARACADRHEHLGMADAAGRIPHPPVPLAHDARAAGRALSAGPSQCPGAARGVSVRRRPRQIPARGAGRLRGRPARCRDPNSDMGVAALDPPR